MTLVVLSLAVLAASAFLMWWFRDASRSFADFAAAGRGLGAPLLFTSIAATFVGPGLSLGLSGQAFDTGFFFALGAAFYALQLLFVAYAVPGRIAKRCSGALSLGDVVGGEGTHASRAVALATGVFSLLVMIGVAGIMVKIAGDVTSAVLPLSPLAASVLITILVASYSVFGGISASIKTDSIQFFVFVLVLVGFAIVLAGDPRVSAAAVLSTGIDATNAAAAHLGIAGFLAIATTFLIGDILQPPFTQRLLAARDAEEARRAYLWSGGFFLFWVALMAFLGIAAVLVSDPGTTGEGALLVLAEGRLPTAAYWLFMASVLLIVLSSHDSILNAGATVLVRDVVSRLAPGPIAPRRLLHLSAAATVLVSLAALALSQVFTSIMGGLLFLASLWAPTMGVPILASLFLPRPDATGALFAMGTGLATSALWQIAGGDVAAPAILVGLGASAGAYALCLVLRPSRLAPTRQES